MKSIRFVLLVSICIVTQIVVGKAQVKEDDSQVRGIMISTPSNEQVDRFIGFINNELAPAKVNHLILKVNYHLEYESRPEIREKKTISKNNIKRILEVCKQKNIELIPLVNCLGHQSWGKEEKNIRALLKAYPEFEENPEAKIDEKNFYCRSYCPRHPKVHEVLFDMLRETIDAFETDRLHVGMDEVFVIGEDVCKRCKGEDKAELYAEEVNRLHKFLKAQQVDMWMWGDRFIDGKTTGLGLWQADTLGIHKAIDLVSKDIVICDWHYKIAPYTATYFAIKGFPVISCSYQVPSVAVEQVNEMRTVRKASSKEVAKRMKGVMHTFWGGVGTFMDAFEGKPVSEKTKQAMETFKELSSHW
ncbi:glycoside hydrolase [Puteibacter caeruleilacunae]|nr:glycoside hydrolase [Puteibacter caeruleilacunae]